MAKKNPAPAARPTTKPSTSAPAPTPATAKPPEDDLEDESIDDDLDGPDTAEASAGKSASWKATMKLPPAKRSSVRIGNLVDRLTAQQEMIAKWPGLVANEVAEILRQSVDGLKDAATKLAALPDDYRPRAATTPKSKGATVELLPGSKVSITDKRKSEYEGILEPEQMTGIEVLEVRGNKVVCKMSDGVRAFIARGHLMPEVAASA